MSDTIIPRFFDNTEVDFADGQPWITQRGLMELFQAKSIQAVNYHIKNFKKSHAAYINQSIKESLILNPDGIKRHVEFYNLKVITYVGYRMNETERTLAFQEWVDGILLEYVHRVMRQNALLAQSVKGYEQAARYAGVGRWLENSVPERDR